MARPRKRPPTDQARLTIPNPSVNWHALTALMAALLDKGGVDWDAVNAGILAAVNARTMQEARQWDRRHARQLAHAILALDAWPKSEEPTESPDRIALRARLEAVQAARAERPRGRPRAGSHWKAAFRRALRDAGMSNKEQQENFIGLLFG